VQSPGAEGWPRGRLPARRRTRAGRRAAPQLEKLEALAERHAGVPGRPACVDGAAVGDEGYVRDVPGWVVSAFVRLAQVYISESVGLLAESVSEVADRLALADAVSRFHTRNGADVCCVHWMADPSPRGMEQSLGIMASYLYAGGDDMHLRHLWSWHPVGARRKGLWRPLGAFTSHEHIR